MPRKIKAKVIGREKVIGFIADHESEELLAKNIASHIYQRFVASRAIPPAQVNKKMEITITVEHINDIP
jgi:hypothetical protein